MTIEAAKGVAQEILRGLEARVQKTEAGATLVKITDFEKRTFLDAKSGIMIHLETGDCNEVIRFVNVRELRLFVS